MGRGALLLATGLALPRTAWAHAGDASGSGWSFDPWTGVPILAIGALYAAGLLRLWSRSAVGKGVSVTRSLLYLAGLALLAAALHSPLEHLAQELFSAHMVQHQLLMIVAAPLLVLGRPGPALLWSLPQHARWWLGRTAARGPVQHAWRAATQPLTAWVLFFGALWVWHLPALYQAGVEQEAVHRLQHLSFFAGAMIYWSSVLAGSAPASAQGLAVLSTFGTAVHSSALGALLTVSGRVWYPVYEGTVGAHGLSAIEDQQLGGLIMWVPGGAVFAGAALGLVLAWLRAAEAQAAENERRRASVAAPLPAEVES